jgi:hypothetical protein
MAANRCEATVSGEQVVVWKEPNPAYLQHHPDVSWQKLPKTTKI